MIPLYQWRLLYEIPNPLQRSLFIKLYIYVYNAFLGSLLFLCIDKSLTIVVVVVVVADVCLFRCINRNNFTRQFPKLDR